MDGASLIELSWDAVSIEKSNDEEKYQTCFNESNYDTGRWECG